MKVNRKDIYFIWDKLKNSKAELMERVKVSLAKYLDMLTCFVMIVAIISDIS